MDKILISSDLIISFLEKCNNEANILRTSLDKIGAIKLPQRMASLRRQKILYYYQQALDFFIGRVGFITKCLADFDEGLEPLDNLLRGLIEIYCRIAFIANSSEEEALKRIIWQEIYLMGLISMPSKHASTTELERMDYSILRDIGESLPDIANIKKVIQDSLSGKKSKDLWGYLNKYRFPNVNKWILESHKEEERPTIKKEQLLRLYSMLSEQLHSNFYLEYGLIEKSGSKFRTLAFLVVIYLRFLHEASKRAGKEEDIHKLLDEAETFRIDFMNLWNISKSV